MTRKEVYFTSCPALLQGGDNECWIRILFSWLMMTMMTFHMMNSATCSVKQDKPVYPEKGKIMDIKNLMKTVSEIEKFVNFINENKTPFEDIKALSRIDPSIDDAVESISKWVDNDVCQPIDPWLKYDPSAEWIKNYQYNLMVSSNGEFWSLTQNNIIKPRYVGGDLRLELGEDSKRASVVIAQTFKVVSNNRECEMVIVYKDGDHRNIKPSNIIWKKKSDVPSTNTWTLLIEDICRRLIDTGGDVNKTLTYYTDSEPYVDIRLIVKVLLKEKYEDISDKFFLLNGNDFIPREEIMTVEDDAMIYTTGLGFDVASFFISSRDKVIAHQLLMDKIKDGKFTLSDDEKTMCIFSAIESIGGKSLPKSKDIETKIHDMFHGLEIPYVVIDHLIKNGNNEIINLYRK